MGSVMMWCGGQYSIYIAHETTGPGACYVLPALMFMVMAIASTSLRLWKWLLVVEFCLLVSAVAIAQVYFPIVVARILGFPLRVQLGFLILLVAVFTTPFVLLGAIAGFASMIAGMVRTDVWPRLLRFQAERGITIQSTRNSGWYAKSLLCMATKLAHPRVAVNDLGDAAEELQKLRETNAENKQIRELVLRSLRYAVLHSLIEVTSSAWHRLCAAIARI
jgi:hypothetical protein